MSNNLAIYTGIEDDGGQPMSITAFMAGKHGHGVQFTMGGVFCALAENQVRDLIERLQKRLACEKGYSATDYGDEALVHPEGVKRTVFEPFPSVKQAERGP